jgi:hypothetical protein
MDIKKIMLHVLGITLLCSASSILPQIYVKNNSVWDIKYKIAEAADNRKEIIASEKVIQPGRTIQIDANEPFSIRRSGKGSSYVSSWTQVPVMEIWRRDIGRGPSSYRETYKETLLIGTSYTGGWDFKFTVQR